MLFQIGLIGITGNGSRKKKLANRKTLKEWEDEKGVRIRRRKHKLNVFTEKQYKYLIQNEYITCKTEKGLEYLENL